MITGKAPSNSNFTAWQTAANQQKAIAESGKPSVAMQGAVMASGGGPAYGQVQGTINNAWANYNPTRSQFNQEVKAGNAQAEAFRKYNQRKKRGGSSSSQGNGYTGQSTISEPRYLADSTTEDAANNLMAQGYQQADPRYQMKKLAKAGVSSGAGQQFIAGQEGAQAMSQAAGQAADIRSQDQMANDKMRSDYEQMREQEALQKAMLQHKMSQSDWSRKFAEQSANASLQMSYLNALQNLRMQLLR